MKLIFKDYLDIFEKYPKDDYLTREERKERYNLLQEYKRRNYDDEVNIDEFQDFINKYEEEIKIFPQFISAFSEILKEDINNGGVKALKFLIGDEEENDYTLQFAQSVYNEFGIDNVYTFADKILEKEPDYLPALKQKYRFLSNYINFSIHELPWGILDGNSCAEKDAKLEMLNNLDKFSKISEKLGKDNEEYIEECRIYYNAWFDFLGNRDEYESYEEYLDKNNIEY